MGHLANLFLALLAVALADQVGPLMTPQPVLAVLLVPAPFLFVPLVRRAVHAQDYARANRLLSRLRRSPVLAQLAADVLFGWGATLDAWRGPSELPPGWPTPWELLRFLPFVAVTVTSLVAAARSHAESAQAQRWLGFQLRAFFGAALPFLALILADSLLALAPRVAWSVHVVELYASLHSLLLLLGLSAAVPLLLRHAWAAEPLPEGGVRELVEFVARRAQFHCKEVLLWRTGRSVANAMIVGVLPRTRRIFFSDSLIESLPARELAAVSAHEIGHAKRGHMALFLMLALGGFGALSLLAREWQPEWMLPFELAVLGLLAPGVFAFRWLSRRFELEADLFACELTGDPRAIGDALLRLGGRLRDVAGWRHFAPSARDAFLQRATTEPPFRRAFDRRMRLARIAIVAFFVLGFGGSFVGKFADFGTDRYRLALWTGRYTDAVEIARELELSPAEQDVLGLAERRLGNGAGLTRTERGRVIRELAFEVLPERRGPEQARWLLEAAEALGDAEAAELDAILYDARGALDPAARDALPPEWRRLVLRAPTEADQ
ncbi:MAG: M48 family metalloprotease [Planctomycetes bacterium]|nr:M48 family metalloprotease [Planctomycetota bacterium]MCB9905099.1 M48 family metalloprotease [Planctomycetota bacterium]